MAAHVGMPSGLRHPQPMPEARRDGFSSPSPGFQGAHPGAPSGVGSETAMSTAVSFRYQYPIADIILSPSVGIRVNIETLHVKMTRTHLPMRHFLNKVTHNRRMRVA
jgi:hypothetical protein